MVIKKNTSTACWLSPFMNGQFSRWLFVNCLCGTVSIPIEAGLEMAGWGSQASAEISLIHKVTKGSVTLNKVNTGLIM